MFFYPQPIQGETMSGMWKRFLDSRNPKPRIYNTAVGFTGMRGWAEKSLKCYVEFNCELRISLAGIVFSSKLPNIPNKRQNCISLMNCKNACLQALAMVSGLSWYELLVDRFLEAPNVTSIFMASFPAKTRLITWTKLSALSDYKSKQEFNMR